MASLVTTAGSRIYIGPAMAFTGTDLVAGDFPSTGEGAITWTEIKGHTDLGSSGDTSELVTSNQIGIRRTRKAKGSRNAGSKTLIMDFDPTDAGQIAILAAEKTDDSYAFKITLDDAPTGGTPSERYFLAFVMSHEEQLGEANNAVKISAMLEIDSNIVRVAAAEAD